MKKLYVIFIFFVSFNLLSQSTASIYVDNVEINFESSISIPYWLSEGKEVDLGPNVKSLSIIEFNVDNNDLVFNQVLHLTSNSQVPTSKVWKIVALGLGIDSSGSSYSISGFSNDTKPSIFTSPIEFLSNGSWIVPQGITSICIEAWGAGGHGGSSPTDRVGTAWGGGGGGGAYGYECFSVTPGTSLNIVFDDSGTSVNNLIFAGKGTDGTNAYFDGPSTSDAVYGDNGVGGTSTAAYNIPGQDGSNGNGGSAGNGGSGGDRGDTNRAPEYGEFPGGGGGGSRLYNSNYESGRSGGGGKVLIYF